MVHAVLASSCTGGENNFAIAVAIAWGLVQIRDPISVITWLLARTGPRLGTCLLIGQHAPAAARRIVEYHLDELFSSA